MSCAVAEEGDSLSLLETALTVAGMAKCQFLPRFGLFELAALTNTSRYLRGHYLRAFRVALARLYSESLTTTRRPFRDILFPALAFHVIAYPLHRQNPHAWCSLQAMCVMAMWESPAAIRDQPYVKQVAEERLLYLLEENVVGLPPALRIWKQILDAFLASGPKTTVTHPAECMGRWLCALIHARGCDFENALEYISTALDAVLADDTPDSIGEAIQHNLRWRMVAYLLDMARYTEYPRGLLWRVCRVLKINKSSSVPIAVKIGAYAALATALKHLPPEATALDERGPPFVYVRWTIFAGLATADPAHYAQLPYVTHMLVRDNSGILPPIPPSSLAAEIGIRVLTDTYAGIAWTFDALALLCEIGFAVSRDPANCSRQFLEAVRDPPFTLLVDVFAATPTLYMADPRSFFERLYKDDPGGADVAMAELATVLSRRNLPIRDVFERLGRCPKIRALFAASANRLVYEAIETQFLVDVIAVAEAPRSACNDAPSSGHWVRRMMDAAFEVAPGNSVVGTYMNSCGRWTTVIEPMLRATPELPDSFPLFSG